MSICNLDHFAESYWHTRPFGLVGGAFDPLHEGHLAYFEAARAFAPWLVCAVTPDAELRQKRTPCLPELTRVKVLNRCRDVEHVHLATMGIPAVIRALRPTHYIVGADWKHRLPQGSLDACVEHGVIITTVDCRDSSSTALLADYETRRNVEKLAAFEQFVSQQTPAEKPWEPVTDYSFEARKAIEGPHAQLIKDTLQPTYVLDAGCGHGHLVRMLNDCGVSAFGVDVTPPEGYPYQKQDITGRIRLGEGFTFDLVICREVLEHLTVRQIAVAVRNLVKLSSKYVYATTRFSAGSHAWDFDSRDDLDPTHITLLNQDYLRSLFVLEGCTRRADLEQRLDWQQKGRVLVYEVPA